MEETRALYLTPILSTESSIKNATLSDKIWKRSTVIWQQTEAPLYQQKRFMKKNNPAYPPFLPTHI